MPPIAFSNRTDLEKKLQIEVAALEYARRVPHRNLRSIIGDAYRAGQSVRSIAAELGKSQTEVHGLLTTSSERAADGSVRGWMTARDAVTEANQLLQSRRENQAFRELQALKMVRQAVTHLSHLRDADDVAEWAVTPAKIHHQGLDTLLQALTQRHFQARQLPPPEWAHPRPLQNEWILAALPSRTTRVKDKTPSWLARLNVYVSRRDLTATPPQPGQPEPPPQA